MSSTDKLAGIFSQKFSDLEHVKKQFSGDSGGVATRFEYFQTDLKLQDSGLRMYTRSIAGDALIWGNSNFGIWGSGLWRASTNTSFIMGHAVAGVLGTCQLGSNLSAWVQLDINDLKI